VKISLILESHDFRILHDLFISFYSLMSIRLSWLLNGSVKPRLHSVLGFVFFNLQHAHVKGSLIGVYPRFLFSA